MALLSKKSILEANDQLVEKVNVPEWGGEVYLKPLSVNEKEEFDKKQMNASGTYEKVNTAGYIYDLLSLSLVDEKYKPMFSREEIEKLGEKSAKVINMLYGRAINLSFVSLEELESLKKK